MAACKQGVAKKALTLQERLNMVTFTVAPDDGSRCVAGAVENSE
jgi:hypothetical protein